MIRGGHPNLGFRILPPKVASEVVSNATFEGKMRKPKLGFLPINILPSQVDRSELGSAFCDEGRDFESTHNLPYTKRNCELIQNLNEVGHINCSLLRTTKLSTEGAFVCT